MSNTPMNARRKSREAKMEARMTKAALRLVDVPDAALEEALRRKKRALCVAYAAFSLAGAVWLVRHAFTADYMTFAWGLIFIFAGWALFCVMCLMLALDAFDDVPFKEALALEARRRALFPNVFETRHDRG